MSDSQVQKFYVDIGSWVGDAVSYSYLGEVFGMKRKVNQWTKMEAEYAKRGFRTVSLDRFVKLGGYGIPIDDIIGKKREEGEEAIFHAVIYQNRFLGKIEPVIDLEKMMKDGKPQTGTYITPSTED